VGVVVAGLFAAAPYARADKILYERVTRPEGERWWVIRPDGSHARRLPIFGGKSEEPDLTSDGRRLVFNSLTNGALMTSPLAHRRIRVVSRRAAVNPRWSPSGERIAAVALVKPPSNWPEGGNFWQVFVIRPGGGRPRRLRTPVSMASPSWSPDGRRIVAAGSRFETEVCTGTPPLYLDRECTTTFATGLWVINVATGAAREILHFENEWIEVPAWSPNGRTIAFNRTRRATARGERTLWTVRPAGSGLRQLTPLLVEDQPPSWSPDGRRLAITTPHKGGGSDIATIRADGSGLRVLTHSGLNFHPDWSR
jgi:Tol biopolymer transport system component